MDPGTKCRKTKKHTKTHTTQNCVYEAVGILFTDWTFKNKVLVFYYEYIILKRVPVFWRWILEYLWIK